VARKTVLVCDSCGKEVGENRGATLRLPSAAARRGARQADLCDDCATKMPGRAVARRGAFDDHARAGLDDGVHHLVGLNFLSVFLLYACHAVLPNCSHSTEISPLAGGPER